MGKVVGAVAGGAVLLLLAFIVIAGGGTVASADPSASGCAVTVGGGQPGPAGPGTTTGNQKDANLNANQMSVARTIVATGKGMNVAERGIAIALGVAMQESTLNPNAVSGRSVGLFQQQGDYYKDINRTDPAEGLSQVRCFRPDRDCSKIGVSGPTRRAEVRRDGCCE